MSFTPSQKVANLSTGVFIEVANKMKEMKSKGADIINLSVGSPDLPPAPIVVETLMEASADVENYGYTLKGTADFHEAVCYFYKNRYHVDLHPEKEVLQLMGSQDGLAHLATAMIDPGDYVLVPDPGYPIYEASVTLAGGEIYPMPLKEENQFLPQLEMIPTDIAKKAKMMILSYPGNPVTALANEDFFKEVIEFAKKHQILVVHDFAYSELIFDGNPQISFMAIPGAKEVGIEFNSLSKTFNMAGCRIGYVVGNESVIEILATLKSHIDYGVFLPIQKAAEKALTADYSILADQVKVYEKRRDAFIASLHKAGWKVATSAATMFIWAKIPDGWKSRDFAFSLIEKAGVAVTPGDAFGKEGEGYVRIAIVQPEERLVEAAKRIGEFLK